MGEMPWPKWNPKGSPVEGLKQADSRKRRQQIRMATRAEERFAELHGMSSMEHMETFLRGQNQIVDGCECFACSGYRHRKVLAEKETRKLQGYTMKQALNFQVLLGLKS
ncbi:hypothetical protein UFOVP142_10 [uncultured Caudovirales phage]|uniref:Uncharacterized protein n=1 Tax=uncultured Caudovirales phage TaxID=2100421 RepID=A0A6J7XKL7_9CAUD|nr:hypothetical protein UFOVP142_10 [uncultured Caudovirales phage]